MRGIRYVVAFVLGAVSMLALLVGTGGVAPGTVERVRLALYDETPPPAAPPAEVAPAPAGSMPQPPSSAGARAAPVPGREAPTDALPAGPGLLIPVQGTLAASLVDTYNQARGEGRRHDAIDIMAARGTPVVAAADGVVMKLFQSERGGITLYQLAADRRTIYYYAHLDRYAPGIVEGRALRRGEVLGFVGNTGVAGPGNYHLHFEVSTTRDPGQYWGGVPQNPYPLLR